MSSQPAETKKDITTNTSKTPLAAQAPMFSDIWGKAVGAVDNFSPFGGDIIAAPNPMQKAGVGDLYNASGSVGTNAAPTADMARKVASGFFLNPANDPTFDGAVKAAIAPITRTLQEQVLPGIVDRSIRAGGTGSGPSAYGGASQDIQENQAVQNWTKQASDTAASMAMASRNKGLDLIPTIPALNTGANAEALAAPGTKLAAGETQRTLDQATLDNELQKWNMSSTSSIPLLQQVASILQTGGFGNNAGTSNEVDTGPKPNLLTQWLQGLTGAAGATNSLFGAAKGGTSAASGLMSALSAISDRRLKHGIEQIGVTYHGLAIYRYYFHGTGRWEIGFMADEVEQVVPEAVTTICGIKTVDYELATAGAGIGADHG